MSEQHLKYMSPADGFQDPDREGVDAPASARAVVIPFGLEASVSYGGGTGRGPAAILAASQQLELFDEELWCEPYRDFGIATLQAPEIAVGVEPALNQLEQIVDDVLDQKRFPLILGGEHSLTAGAIRPFARRIDELIVLQIDAHADLRDGYLGEHYSHASAMRRVLDHANCRVVSYGIRAICQAEADYIDANPDRVDIYWAHEQDSWDMGVLYQALKGRQIYVTFDIDGLDGAEMPATGTPTPGGLSFWRALDIVRVAASAGTIVGADVVELSPIAGFHAYDYTAAAVANKILNYALSGTTSRRVPS
ncbi:MAG: agmatinase [Hyphomicrobiaceae bacterium]|jgi:agmatinase